MTEMKDAVLKKGEEKGWIAEKWLIAMEEHEDGANHYHMFIKMQKKINVTTADSFDVEYLDALYHPNIQGARNDGACVRYCKKDGNWLSNYHEQSTWELILKEDITVEEGIAMVVQKNPRDWCLHGQQIESNLRRVKRQKMEEWKPLYTAANFKNIPEAMTKWLQEEYPKTDRAKSLIIVGPSQYGKTAWAKSIGPYMHMQGMFNLKEWNDEAKLIIIDDIPWKFIPNKNNC